jgi:putative glutamine amidotransferase
MAPIIGITPDRNDSATNIESYYFVRRNYCDAIVRAGGIPLILPYQHDKLDAYADLIQGLLVTGGMFDVDPEFYGMPPKFPEELTLKADRTHFERAMLQGALARDMPIVGVCGGMQLIAVEMGAKLIQHIPSEIETDVEHKQEVPCDVATHRININEKSMLRGILGTAHCDVNSLHHQSVMAGNDNLRVAATAEDGVVEAVEVPGRSLCIGVQWHPEYLANPWDQNLFTAFISAAKSYGADNA